MIENNVERSQNSKSSLYIVHCFSFKCGIEYHAPTDCDVIKKWLTKCADDSETANYISANTKDVRYIWISCEAYAWLSSQHLAYLVKFSAGHIEILLFFPENHFI